MKRARHDEGTNEDELTIMVLHIEGILTARGISFNRPAILTEQYLRDLISSMTNSAETRIVSKKMTKFNNRTS